MQAAVADPHCLAAYRSAGGFGIRLVLRVPKTSASEHRAVFESAAQHVRGHYHVEPDTSGKDVSRASFVSWDGGLWLNAQAVVLPVKGLGRLHSDNHCVNRLQLKTDLPWWHWLAKEHIPYDPKGDGTYRTHFALLELGKRLSLRAARERFQWRKDAIDQIVKVWFEAASHAGRPVRGTADDYSEELMVIVSGAKRCQWFHSAANKWVRWTKHGNFPTEPKERLLFAIQQHCAEHGTREFYIGCRDAGCITGTSHSHANGLLMQLVRDKKIALMENPNRPARHALEYKLLDPK
jgi:hypothetical protein